MTRRAILWYDDGNCQSHCTRTLVKFKVRQNQLINSRFQDRAGAVGPNPWTRDALVPLLAVQRGRMAAPAAQ